MATTTLAQYRIKGTTGDITTCEQCGRNNLRKTVVLAPLDEDGNEYDVVHFGVDCASRALGRRQTAIRNEAAAYDFKVVKARRWAAETLPWMQTHTVAEYIDANRYFLGRPVEEAAAAQADTIAECNKILAGDITGTRFDR